MARTEGPPALEVHDFPGPTGRGLRCRAAAPKGSTLLEVPLAHCWTAPAARDALPSLPPVKDDDAMTLHLLHVEALGAGGGDAARHEHVQTLPREFDLPVLWSDEELEELRGSGAYGLAVRLKEETREDYNSLVAALRDGGAGALADACNLTWDRYLWARCVFWTRQCDLDMGEGKKQRQMVPLMDMLNHSPEIEVGTSHHLSEKGDAVVVFAGRDFKAGEEALISYGEVPGFKLLSWYGFVLPNNPHDAFDVVLSLTVNAEQLELHRAAAAAHTIWVAAHKAFKVVREPPPEELAGGGSGEYIVCHSLTADQPLPELLVDMTRIQHLSPAQLVDPAIRQVVEAGKDLPIPIQARALAFVKTLLEAQAAAFPRPLAEEEALLAQGGLTGRRRMAADVRAGELRALAAAGRAAASRLAEQLARAVALAAAVKPGGCDCAACAAAGSPWACFLAGEPAARRLAAGGDDVMALYQPFMEHLGTDDLWQAQAWLAEGLAGLGRGPAAELSRACPGWWPVGPVAAGAGEEGEGRVEAPAAGMDQALAAAGGKIEYLATFGEKVSLWGAYLAAQWAACRAMDPSAYNTMWGEPAALRSQFACSVPSPRAIAAIAARGPLVEIGAGTGYWAHLLRDHGADVVAYDTSKWDPTFQGEGEAGAGGARAAGSRLVAMSYGGVKAGGPDKASAHPDRALVLMWPDYEGRGTYGLESLRAYGGSTLVLVGEWEGRTFGRGEGGAGGGGGDGSSVVAEGTLVSEAQARPEWGGSFSRALQQEVAARGFKEAEVVRLPNWALCLDAVMIFTKE